MAPRTNLLALHPTIFGVIGTESSVINPACSYSGIHLGRSVNERATDALVSLHGDRTKTIQTISDGSNRHSLPQFHDVELLTDQTTGARPLRAPRARRKLVCQWRDQVITES
jgi:hypothetical protein